MDATSISFGIKDVVAICIGLISIMSFLYALISSNKSNKLSIESLKDATALSLETLKDSTNLAIKETEKDLAEFKMGYTSNMLALRSEVETKFMHARNAKKANVVAIFEEIEKAKEEMKEKETRIYSEMNQLRMEAKGEHEKLSSQILNMNNKLDIVSSNLAELTGWVKANQQNHNKQ